jgi:hypothetical protein
MAWPPPTPLGAATALFAALAWAGVPPLADRDPNDRVRLKCLKKSCRNGCAIEKAADLVDRTRASGRVGGLPQSCGTITGRNWCPQCTSD